MKKISFVFFIFLISNSLNAAGVFEISDIQDTYSVKAGKNFTTYISFYYSGTAYVPIVSTTGKFFPEDLKLGRLEEKGGGLYNIKYSGTPHTPGKYPLTLVLSDDFGAILTKKFTVDVSGVTFNDVQLPDAIVNKEYSQNINFKYGNDPVLINLSEIPESFGVDFLNINASNDSFVLKLVPHKTGQFTFNVNAFGSEDKSKLHKLGQKTYTLNVVYPNQNLNEISKVSIVDKATSSTTKAEVSPNIASNKEVEKKVIDLKLKKEEKISIKNIPEKKTQQRATNTSEVKKIETKLVVPYAMYPNVVTTSDAKVKIKWYEKVFNWFQGF